MNETILKTASETQNSFWIKSRTEYGTIFCRSNQRSCPEFWNIDM